MTKALGMFIFVMSVITGLSGTTMNSLVLTLYLLQWEKSSNSVVCDQIHISIAVTNVVLQGFLSVDGVLNSLVMFNPGKNILLLLFTLHFAFYYASAWNTAWLSIFFYVRLVNFSHPYLLRMKAMFLSSVPQLIVGSALGSIIISLPFYWLTEIDLIQNRTLTTDMGIYNATINFKFAMINSFFGSFLPFTLTCLCIGQCVTSLLRHVWRMKFRESHLTSSQLQGHIRAARIMIMRVVLDMTMYLSIIGALLTSFQMNTIIMCCTWTIIMMYPTAQSLILIHGNPKLKSNICRQCVIN